MQWKTEQAALFKVQSVNKTGYDCHYGKVKYHAHFVCMCLLSTDVVDTENKESNVMHSTSQKFENGFLIASKYHNTYCMQNN